MGGVVAGTRICEYESASSNLKMVALTVNNECNLNCSHCYLRYNSRNSIISSETIDHVLRQEFDDLVIVGREPFLNKEVVKISCEIAKKAKSIGKNTSVITNGTNLDLLEKNQFNLFRFIDVSFDGGPATYKKIRNFDYNKLINNIQYATSCGADVRALNVLYKENIGNIDDMMETSNDTFFSRIMFSPYMNSENHGFNKVGEISIIEMLEALFKNKHFMENKKAFFLLDAYHLSNEKIDHLTVNNKVLKLGMEKKVHFVPATPLKIGSVRVTFDGLVLSPDDSVHPRIYRKKGLNLLDWKLEDAYEFFSLKEETKEIEFHSFMNAA